MLSGCGTVQALLVLLADYTEKISFHTNCRMALARRHKTLLGRQRGSATKIDDLARPSTASTCTYTDLETLIALPSTQLLATNRDQSNSATPSVVLFKGHERETGTNM